MKKRDISGEKNPRWNNGTSEYPNHAKMKRNRLIRLKEAQNKCEVCGAEAYCIHHIDDSKDNHRLDNLAVLCNKCHNTLHAGKRNYNNSNREKNSKYIRLYGLTLREMKEKYGMSSTKYLTLHNKGILKEKLMEWNKKLDKKLNI